MSSLNSHVNGIIGTRYILTATVTHVHTLTLAIETIHVYSKCLNVIEKPYIFL